MLDLRLKNERKYYDIYFLLLKEPQTVSSVLWENTYHYNAKTILSNHCKITESLLLIHRKKHQ